MLLHRAAFLVASSLVACLPSQTPAAPAPQRIETIELLWPAGAPLAQGDAARDRPSLSLYLAPADRSNGTAVVVCPGGGYGTLAINHEGHDIGEYFNRLGISAFVLRYRIAPHYHHPCPKLDVQRAIRMVRARAVEWRIDPARIGVMGFSAGGHLASTALTHFDVGDPGAADAIDRCSCRPDFGVLVYPVIALDQPYTHQGSKRNLLGERANDAALVAELSTAQQVRDTTPPCFLVHTTADTAVPPENSIDFYLALRRAKVPAELHIYQPGAHGFGLAVGDPVLGTWPGHLEAWLRGRGWLAPR
jgi:acetyl esterase/lipase